MARKEKGERRLPSGNWQVFVRLNGQFISETLPATTTVEARRQWRADQLRTVRPEPAPIGGSFWDDIQQHLARPSVQAVASFKERAAHLALWAATLGRDRARESIRPREVEAIAHRWRSTPTNQPDPTVPGSRGRPSAPTGLSAGSVRKRLKHLHLFFKERNGEAGANPVRGLFRQHREPKPEARAIDYSVIERALASMPRTYRTGAPGQPPRTVLNLAAIRLRVIAYTGIPPELLQQLEPHHLELTVPGRVRVPPRDKGQGVEARTLELTPQGLAAFKAFHAARAYGRFSVSALNSAFKRALRRIGVTATLHLYDLRHSFLTEVYRVTRDEATVARLALHAEGSAMTARYTRGAHTDVDQAAAAAVGAAFAAREAAQFKAELVPNPSQKLHAKVARASK